MAFLLWLVRCAPGISLICLLVYVESSLGILRTELGVKWSPSLTLPYTVDSILQSTFVLYALILHILALAFPVRLCRAAWYAATSISLAYANSAHHKIPESENKDTSAPREDPMDEEPNIVMAIVVPSYKEDIGILEDTLRVLASHKLARTNYDVYLAMEERDRNAVSTAEQLLDSFRDRFFDMRFTLHPSDIEGEAPGKSSNVSWAAKEVERVYSDCGRWKNVLVTVMDSDTHLLTHYFEHIYASHMRNRQTEHIVDMTLYVPPIVFDRNAHKVPRLVRVADLMWCGAGLSCYQRTPTLSDIAIPTAVYTVPLALVRSVGGWDGGPEAIGEDMHMMLKCYFATNGRLNIESVPSPASQCNISTDRKGIRGWMSHHGARYSQGLRHMWGCLDTGFALKKWSGMKKAAKPNVPIIRDDHGRVRPASPPTRKLSHTDLQLKLSQISLHGSKPCLFSRRHFVLFSRLFEAHFLPGHLLITIFACATFTALTPPSKEHWIVQLCLDLMGYLRAASYAVMMFYFLVVYERYHSICVQTREREMMLAGLHVHLGDQFSHRRRTDWWLLIDYLIFPVAGTIFGSIPLYQAAVSHFWTDKLVYLVSAKPVKAMLEKVRPSFEERRTESA